MFSETVVLAQSLNSRHSLNNSRILRRILRSGVPQGFKYHPSQRETVVSRSVVGATYTLMDGAASVAVPVHGVRFSNQSHVHTRMGTSGP